MKNVFLAALMVSVSASIVWAQAQPELTDEQFAIEFVINNSTYTLYHEIGHMLIGELGIPVLAKEEDAADNLATLLMLSAETVEADNALIDAVDSYFMLDAANADNPIEDAELYDVHSLDPQRAFQIACLAVGADPDIFGEFATNSGIDEDRQENCSFDFEQASASWNAVLEPHLTQRSSRSKISYSYEETETYAGAAAALRDAGILEFAVGILAEYNLPRAVKLTATECGEENAFYDPQAGEITLCYEIVESYYVQALEAIERQ